MEEGAQEDLARAEVAEPHPLEPELNFITILQNLFGSGCELASVHESSVRGYESGNNNLAVKRLKQSVPSRSDEFRIKSCEIDVGLEAAARPAEKTSRRRWRPAPVVSRPSRFPRRIRLRCWGSLSR